MAVTDPKYAFKDSDINAPALEYAAITTGDTSAADFAGGLSRGIYVGVGGNVVAVDKNANAVTFTGVVSGAILPIRCIRINSTSTTATNMVVLF